MSNPATDCILEGRREDVRKAELLGLDYVEVSADQIVLDVFFLGRAPEKLRAANITITGGSPVRITGLHVTRQRDPTLDDWMQVRVNRPGDFSIYTLALVGLEENGHPTAEPMDGFDPRYASTTFSFKASCPSDLDCRVRTVCPPPIRAPTDINYLAKDYGSFRQLILDRLAQTMPCWQETHVPDIGVMLVELLANAGDQLSYYQDAVATEAYLNTARQRISVRRHARLVDYAMHEGCNARAWICINAAADTRLDPLGIFFCTDFPGASQGSMLQLGDFEKAAPGSVQVFEPVVSDPTQSIELYAAHNEIRFYTWGDCACCLPQGATSATLLDTWLPGEDGDRRALNLKVNDLLLFEEVIGPHTGNPADADPRHRQVVRLTEVIPSIDLLYDREKGGRPVLQITWCSEDALRFVLCLSAVMPAPDCTCREGISVARGNLVLVDNGLTIQESLGSVPTRSSAICPTDCAQSEIMVVPGRFRPVLKQQPLTFGQDLPTCGCASTVFTQDPRQALPRISLTSTVTTLQGPATTAWSARPDLLESAGDDAHFVVEMDNPGNAYLRFGNGDEGMVPPAGASFQAAYRVGNGPSGNVGAETIVKLVFKTLTEGSTTLVPRNPLSAAGGTAPETLAEVRMFAPFAFRDVMERAVTADDYAALAGDNARRLAERARLASVLLPAAQPSSDDGDPRRRIEEEPNETSALPTDICLFPFRRLQGARGELRWNGSWYEVEVAVDPLDTETADDELLAEIDAYLERYRRIGHDLRVEAAQYVPLDLGLSVCVMSSYLRGDVEQALLTRLGTGTLSDGSPALFNPNNLTFGQAVYLSPIVAACQSIAGVMEVQVTRLTRFVPGTAPPRATPDQVPALGALALGPLEIARLDDDPNAPANGRLTLILRGGR